MEYGQYLLWQEFNKNFSDVHNCKIISPPYYPGEVPQTFFFAKRDGFTKQFTDVVGTKLDAYDLVLDFQIVESGATTVVWAIATQWANVKLLEIKAAGANVWKSTTYVAGVNYKFFYMPHVRGAAKEDTATVEHFSNGGNTLTWSVSGATLRINSNWNPVWWNGATADYAGKYLYVYDSSAADGAGVGQILKIDSKIDAQYLDVSTVGWKTPPNNCAYAMYDDYGTVLAAVWDDYVYTIPNYEDVAAVTQSILAAKNYARPVDATYASNRLYFIQRPDSATTEDLYSRNILAWGEGFWSLYLGGTALIGSVKEAFNIVQFQDYILIVSKFWIDTIAKLVTKVTWVEETLDILVNVTRDVTLFWQNSFIVYNGGLYVFTDNKKFVGVSIVSENVYRYVVSLQNQGIYLQKFFDNFSSDDTVRIFIEDLDIFLFKSNADGTEIFRYSNFYKGWYRWSSTLRILSKNGSAYYGENIYDTFASALTDDPLGAASAFSQSMQIVSGEDNIFSLKKQFFTKLYVWEEITDGTLVTITSYAGWQSETYEAAVTSAGYFERLSNSVSGATMGSTLLGSWIYMVGGSEVAQTAPMALIKVNTWFTYELCIIELSAEGSESFHLGWILTGYDVMPAQITPLENVV